MPDTAATPTVVMPGLDPGIHLHVMDGRVSASLRPAMTKEETAAEVVAR